jgi:hypothetical protein
MRWQGRLSLDLVAARMCAGLLGAVASVLVCHVAPKHHRDRSLPSARAHVGAIPGPDIHPIRLCLSGCLSVSFAGGPPSFQGEP